MYKQYFKNNLAIIVSDFLLTLLTLFVISWARPYLPGEELAATEVIPHYSMYFLAPISLLVVFTMAGVYSFRSIPQLGRQFKSLLFSYAVWGWFVVGALYFSFRETSRLLVVYFVISNFGILMLSRYAIWKLLQANGDEATYSKVVIFGPVQSAWKLCEMVLKDMPSGYNLIGLSDFREPETTPMDAPFLGTAEALPDIVVENGVDIVIVSLDHTSLSSVGTLVTELMAIPVRVILTQDYSTLPSLDLEIERIGNVVLVGVLEPVIVGWNKLFKRLFDLAFSIVSLLFLWPVFILIGIAVRLESPGPVIFRTKRIGNAGKPFLMYKFRTMQAGAPEFLDTLPVVKPESRQIYKLKDDPRITRVGKFLRRWSLDELPQLLNVLKGQMSLVGPRPEQPFITKQYEPWQWQRIQVPPGITGWWQVHGRSELPMHLNTQLDTYYVANYSIMLDIKILFLTVFEVIRGRGAY